MQKGPITIVICSIGESFGRDGSALTPRREDDDDFAETTRE
jgi:hypothetical protein